MRAKFYNPLKSCGKWFTAPLCGLCSFLLACSASAEVSQSSVDDIADWLSTINAQLGMMKDTQGHMWENLRGIHTHAAAIQNHVIDLKAYAANEEKYLKFYSNRLANLQLGDGLNGNPWWYTNSSFTVFQDWRSGRTDALSHVIPDDPFGEPLSYVSFPQYMSIWSSRLNGGGRPAIKDPVNNWRDWGFSAVTNSALSQSQKALRGYTWFDMVADVLKQDYLTGNGSNQLAGLTAYATAYVEGEASPDYDSSTNALPDMEIDSMEIDSLAPIARIVDADTVESLFPSSYTHANPQLEIFPATQFGVVHCNAVVGSVELPNSVASALSFCAQWFWRIMFIVSVFYLVRCEFDFWSTLGNAASA